VPLEGVAEATEESTASAVAGARAVLARGSWVGGSPVSGSSTANMIYTSFLDHPFTSDLALKFFVKREESSFGVLVDVACSSTTTAELG